MSNVMVIIDGMTDNPIYELGGKTPFQYANCKNINYMRDNGCYGEFKTCPDGFKVDSMNCIMTLLGMESKDIPKGRAYLEALAHDIAIDDDDLVMRCNIVTIDEKGELKSSCGEGISNDEFNDIINRNIATFKENEKVKLYNIGGYKNILVIKGAKCEFESTITYAPHENLGAIIEDIMPYSSTVGTMLEDIMRRSRGYIKNPGDGFKEYMLMPWGTSYVQDVPKFYELHDKKCAVVCATEIVQGIASAMDAYLPKISGATADIDTDLKSKLNCTLKLSKEYEIVIVHINGTDEASHRKRPFEKASFLKSIDEIIVGGLVESNCFNSILVCCDHSSLSDKGSHRGGYQPFFLYNMEGNNKGFIGRFDGKEAIRILTDN